MEQYIPKSAVIAKIERLRKYQRLDDRHDQGVLDGLHSIEKYIDTLEVKEIGVDFGDPRGDKSAKHIIDTKTLEVKEVDLEDAKKEELAQKYIDYTFKRHNIDPDSKEGQLIYYSYMHGMNQCLTQLRKQKGE